jgi:Tol biopolymer transport system component
MTEHHSPGSTAAAQPPSDERLDSWKAIASYMKRDVTTVQRWEKREGMPVHRHLHDKMGSVYAYRTELDAWARTRSLALEAEPELEPASVAADAIGPSPAPRRTWRGAWLSMAAAAALAALAIWWVRPVERALDNPLAELDISPLTDFEGIEQAAAVSRDGKLVVFLSDRDGQTDVWVTQVGVGLFYNLTRGGVRELDNPSVRVLGFSPDGTLVTFWARRSDGSDAPRIGVWAIPVLGGQPRPYLDDAAEFDWSADGSRLVYHTTGPGDPMYVRDPGDRSDPRRIYAASQGLHNHFPVWSPDQAFIYFVQGSVPGRGDIWRIRAAGGTPERMTHHDALVSHPVFLDARTLLYLASDPDGSGPAIHGLDVERRVGRRLSAAHERYTSLAASADGRRLVATLARPKGTLWHVPMEGMRPDMAAARRIRLPTAHASSPRLGAGDVLYVASKGTGDSLWKLQGDTAAELWGAPGARIIGGPALARDGRRLAFSIAQSRQTLLYVANADGTEARIVTRSLELQGAPAWTPDGRAITVAAVGGGHPHLFNIPVDGGPPAPLTNEYSVDPVWSPAGDIVVFSGPDIGATFEVRAVKADGSPHHMPKLVLSRGARHLAFVPGQRALVVLRGEIRHKNLWLIDLDTGADRQLTDLAPDFTVRDFDVSPDGRHLILEQVHDHSDIVLLDVPRR